MTAVATESISLESTQRLLANSERFRSVLLPAQVRRDSRTDWNSTEELKNELTNWKIRTAIESVGAIALAVFIHNARASAEGDLSIPTNVVSAMAALTQFNTHRIENSVADFLEPITFTWSETANQIRLAAKLFSENTHADY